MPTLPVEKTQLPTPPKIGAHVIYTDEIGRDYAALVVKRHERIQGDRERSLDLVIVRPVVKGLDGYGGAHDVKEVDHVSRRRTGNPPAWRRMGEAGVYGTSGPSG